MKIFPPPLLFLLRVRSSMVEPVLFAEETHAAEEIAPHRVLVPREVLGGDERHFHRAATLSGCGVLLLAGAGDVRTPVAPPDPM